MSNRLRIASLVYMMATAVLFGVGIVAILAVPALSGRAFELIPVAVVASLVISAPVAWLIAPRLLARPWRRRNPAPAAGAYAGLIKSEPKL